MGHSGMELDSAREETRARIEEAHDRAVTQGLLEPSSDKGLYGKLGHYQAVWRGWRGAGWGSGAMETFDYQDCMTAVLDALINQGGVVAWEGDGTGCVVQMIATAYEDRDHWKQRALAAEAKLKTD